MANPWITGGLAAANIYTGYRASKQAKESADKANAVAAENLALQKQRLARHRALYGDLEENLAKYYTNLTPEKRAAQGINRFNKKYQATLKKFKADLVARGLTDSGVDLETTAMFDLSKAATESEILQNAETSVLAEKNALLQRASQAQSSLIGNEGNAMNTMAQLYGNQATVKQNQAGKSMQNLVSLANSYGQQTEDDDDNDSWFNNFFNNQSKPGFNPYKAR